MSEYKELVRFVADYLKICPDAVYVGMCSTRVSWARIVIIGIMKEDNKNDMQIATAIDCKVKQIQHLWQRFDYLLRHNRDFTMLYLATKEFYDGAR